MDKLTLEECLKQPRGYEGRLFETPRDQLGIRVPDRKIDTSIYRVLEVHEDRMNIEGYLLGGSFVKIEGVRLSERLKDTVMNSESLMEWYRMAGRAGQAGLM